MRARALSLVAAGAGLVALTASGPVGAAASAVRVLRDGEAARFRVIPEDGTVQPDTTVEPSIAVNPANPRHVVVGYQAGRTDGAAAVGYAVTFDAGRHWTSGLMRDLTELTGGPFTRASDPVVAFGPRNRVYFSSLAFNGHTSAIVNHTSRDGGRHWDAPTMVRSNPASSSFNDKNWVVVDNGTGPGHRTGRVYVAWDNVESVLVSYSDDEGRTWLDSPSVVYPGAGIGTIPLVLPSGGLAVVYRKYDGLPGVPTPLEPEAALDGDAQIAVSTAPGAGLVPTGQQLAFGPPVVVATDRGDVSWGLRAPQLPSADVDPASGRIYIAWKDTRYRTDETNDVVVASSADGVVWTEPVRVNRGRTDDYVDHFTPAVAVAADGTVRIAYRVRREAADERSMSPYVDTYFQTSGDQGATWSAPLRVNRVRTDLRFAAYSRDAAFLGDYMQIGPAGAYTYVVRCEAMRVSPRDSGGLPPRGDHHQRTWVALVGPKGGPLG